MVAETIEPIRASRSALARQRAQFAYRALAACHLCEHHCAVNRLKAERGRCRAGAQARVFSYQTEVADELELVPTFAIAFSGCDLRCDFCITGAESWNPEAGELLAMNPTRFGGASVLARRGKHGHWRLAGTLAPPTLLARSERTKNLPVAQLTSQARSALAHGARTIMFLGGEPTIHLPAILEIVAALPEHARLVLKTNAYTSAPARSLLEGIFDIWLADYKFGDDACALRLAKAPDYTRVTRENLLWADQHSELIVRHLLMPGHVDCCWQPVATWIAAELPGAKVSLRHGFWPGWQAHRHAELCSAVTQTEHKRALDIAQALGLNLVS